MELLQYLSVYERSCVLKRDLDSLVLSVYVCTYSLDVKVLTLFYAYIGANVNCLHQWDLRVGTLVVLVVMMVGLTQPALLLC